MPEPGAAGGRAQHKAPQSRTASEHSKQKHTQAGDCTACSGHSRRVKDIPSWARQPFQRWAVGQDGLGEARRSCPGLLYPEPQTEACAKAMPASTHPWSAATARHGPPRAEPERASNTRSHSGRLRPGGHGHILDAHPSSPLRFPVPGQTLLTTRLSARTAPPATCVQKQSRHLPPLSPGEFRP